MKRIFAIFILLGIGFGLGYLTNNHKINLIKGTIAQQHPIRDANSKYVFINPLLGFDNVKASELGELKSLQSALDESVKKHKDQGDAINISVYYRDLTNGKWVGVNEDDKYSPASLLKVPIMIDYYYIAQKHPEVLNNKIIYGKNSGDANAIEAIKPSQAIQLGQAYTISDLINRMIVYSDNNATLLLYDNLSDSDFNQVFGSLGVILPTVGKPEDFISPKTYSLFFRILYGASYVGRDLSENALSMLNNVEFKDGLVAGLPADTKVAHKFGEYGYVNDQNQTVEELHDCGIVYASEHNYLLCIMTEGPSLDKLKGVIKDISSITYDQVKKGN